MRTRTIGGAAVTAIAFLAAIFVGRDWLVSGGGDWPAFLFWSVLCFASGFALSGVLGDSEFEKRFKEELDKNIQPMTREDIDAILEDEEPGTGK